jgi:hypothetical protein
MASVGAAGFTGGAHLQWLAVRFLPADPVNQRKWLAVYERKYSIIFGGHMGLARPSGGWQVGQT